MTREGYALTHRFQTFEYALHPINQLLMKHLNEIPSKEIVPGFHGKMVHGNLSTMAFFTIAKGSFMPEHHHLNEQISHMLEGELEMMIGGERFLLTSGTVLVIPPGVPHSARALADCKMIDSFSPVREEYR
jgi:quercetin dioxygenase-like cupin family protein